MVHFISAIYNDRMFNMMVDENATQHVNNAAAGLDSVAAAVRRIAKCLIMGAEKHFATIVTKSDFGMVKGNFDKGHGIGIKTILASMTEGSIEEREVRSLLGTLKDSGKFDEIIDEVRAELAEVESAKPTKSTKPSKSTEVSTPVVTLWNLSGT